MTGDWDIKKKKAISVNNFTKKLFMSLVTRWGLNPDEVNVTVRDEREFFAIINVFESCNCGWEVAIISSDSYINLCSVYNGNIDCYHVISSNPPLSDEEIERIYYIVKHSALCTLAGFIRAKYPTMERPFVRVLSSTDKNKNKVFYPLLIVRIKSIPIEIYLHPYVFKYPYIYCTFVLNPYLPNHTKTKVRFNTFNELLSCIETISSAVTLNEV